MKTYFSDIIPKIQRFSHKLDNLTMLTNQHWVVLDEIENTKNVYIFRQNNELLIATNGKVEKGKWEYLGSNSILIDTKNESYLFKHGFFDKNILALKIDSSEEYAFLINETRFYKKLNSLSAIMEFLEKNYLQANVKQENKIPFITPVFKEEYLGVETSFFSSSFDKTKILFEDGKTGVLFTKKDFNKFRIDCFGTRVFYSSKISAINALYSFILNKNILENDRVYI